MIFHIRPQVGSEQLRSWLGFPPKKVRGNKLSSDVKQLIDKVKNGSTIVFRDIKAKGPKGLR